MSSASVRVPWWRSFVFRFVMGFALVVSATVTAAAVWLERVSAHDVEVSFGRQLRATAATAAPFIRSSDLFAIDGNEDADSAEFQRVRQVLERARRTNGLEEDQVYVLRRTGEGDRVEFVVMLQERTFVGDEYDPPPLLSRWYTRVIERGRAEHTSLYTDENGTFVSGVAPIRDPTGQVVGLLQVDQDLEIVLEEIRERSLVLTSGGIALVLFILISGAWTHRRLRQMTLELLRGTQAIEEEDYEHRVPVGGNHELAVVAQALNGVIAQLKERFRMLKFLPDHTKKMIAASLDGAVSLQDSRRVRVVVLESDIRGFTRLTEHMTPEATISMLNQYVRAQAQEVIEHEGSIDKFMGDAVLAVFEGVGMEQRALECAIAMQRVVRSMNEHDGSDAPVEIGVGLSVGDVVMGNMGSEERMEHTVIGATVNLAARLCSAAAAGDIVACAELADQVELPAGVETTREEIKLKGFEQPIPCVRARA